MRNLHRWCNAIASVQAGQMAASAWVSLRVGGGTIAVAVPRDGGRQLCSVFLQVPWWGKVVSQSCGHWLQVGVDVIIVLLVARWWSQWLVVVRVVVLLAIHVVVVMATTSAR